jgi:hypothetical protein
VDAAVELGSSQQRARSQIPGMILR